MPPGSGTTGLTDAYYVTGTLIINVSFKKEGLINFYMILNRNPIFFSKRRKPYKSRKNGIPEGFLTTRLLRTSKHFSIAFFLYLLHVQYTAQTGLPYFDRAAVITIGSWYHGKALEPMRGNQSFRGHLVNIGPIYKQ